MVKKARSNPPKATGSNNLKGMRKHEVPPLNWDAVKWTEIVNMKNLKNWEPRILQKLSLDRVEAALEEPICFPKYPCNSQTVEIMVKLVTEVSHGDYDEKK